MKIWLRTNENFVLASAELANTGVGVVFYHLYEAFAQVGLPVVVNDPNEPCIELWWGWDWHPKKSNNFLVALTLGEALLAFMPGAELFDLIFITTHFHRERQRWQKPLYVWHLGVDPLLFPVLERPQESFTFVHTGTTQYRKGSDLVCEAFNTTFSDTEDAFLDIRCPSPDVEMFVDLKHKYEHNSRIRFEVTNYSRREAWRNYVGDCLVHPSLREGWGLCVTEAMSTGMPVIMSELPIFKELYNDQCGWWVKMCMSEERLGYGFPDLESLQRVMGYVYDHRDECLVKGLYAAQYVRQNLTWEKGITEGFLPVMANYGYRWVQT